MWPPLKLEETTLCLKQTPIGLRERVSNTILWSNYAVNFKASSMFAKCIKETTHHLTAVSQLDCFCTLGSSQLIRVFPLICLTFPKRPC